MGTGPGVVPLIDADGYPKVARSGGGMDGDLGRLRRRKVTEDQRRMGAYEPRL